MSSELRKQIEKNTINAHAPQIATIRVQTLFGLLADYMCIQRKQLEERAHEYLIDGTMDGIAVSNYIKEELLEESK